MTRARDRDRGGARPRVRDRDRDAGRDAAAATGEDEANMGVVGVRGVRGGGGRMGDGAPETEAPTDGSFFLTRKMKIDQS